MVSPQKSTVPTSPVASPNVRAGTPPNVKANTSPNVRIAPAPGVKASPPSRTAAPADSGSTPSPMAGADANCAVHRLEEALQLVGSLQLTDDQKAKISELTKVQAARCAEEKKHHEATHAQILALLTPGQHETLQAAADGAAHGHTDGHPAPAEHAVHA
ncbi:MAG: hypothetical protein NTV51_17195 [Verrucomicrobia bacterium]|nr:hypothetical protein [Verrucomicrobiota bacterium]